MQNKPQYTIAVTGLNAIDSPGPGVSVIRALRDAESFDVNIIGLSYEAMEPGIYMDGLCEKTYQIPLPSSGVDALIQRLEYIHSVEKLDFIIPNFDAELYNFIKISKLLKENYGIASFLPTMEQFDTRHKINLNDFGEEHSIKVPLGIPIYSTAELPKVTTQIKYPLVIKGKFYDAKIAYTPAQAAEHFNKISAKWGLPIIAQELVYGNEVNVCGIADGEGKLIGAVPMRKLFITDKGKAWAGVSIDDQELLKITTDLMQSSKWRGPFELEFIKTTESDYYLLEINPRFPAWVYLTVSAGQNQVEAMVNLGMGKAVEAMESYEVGKMFIRYSYDMIVNLSEFEKISTLGEL